MTSPLVAFGAAIAQSYQQFHALPSSPQAWDGTSLQDRDSQVIEAMLPLLKWAYEHYYKVETQGLEQVPDGPILMVGSHNGGLGAPDMFMLMYAWFQQFGTERPAYGLMNPKMWTGYPDLAKLAARSGAVRAHPKIAIAALKAQASVLVYPGGARDVFRHHRLRHQIFLNGNLAFIKLALREGVPIVPVVSTGAHDTLEVMGDLYPFLSKLHDRGMPWLLDIDPEVWPIFKGWPWGIGVGPLLNIPFPQPIRLKVGQPIIFDRMGAAATKDPNYLLRCYDQVHAAMQRDLNELAAATEV